MRYFKVIVLSLFLLPTYALLVLFLTPLLSSSLFSRLLSAAENVSRRAVFKVVSKWAPPEVYVVWRLVFLDHIPPSPPMGKGARLFLGSVPSVSIASWFPVHQEQDNLG